MNICHTFSLGGNELKIPVWRRPPRSPLRKEHKRSKTSGGHDTRKEPSTEEGGTSFGCRIVEAWQETTPTV